MGLGLFHADQLSILMLLVIALVGATVLSFSTRYLDGDSEKSVFIKRMFLLLGTLALVGVVDNIFLFIFAWGMSNAVLIRLMIHKASWKAALNAGTLAAKNLLFGLLMIAACLLILGYGSGTTSIQAIIRTDFPPIVLAPALMCMTLGVMAQSAIWPFHRWLISSVNSPTPVSAIMHAGLVNGGGILLARLSPLYLASPVFLDCLFVMGLYTALIGTTWKLMQSDIKRMLACSTMGQMGFMVMQCGLGLFPAALTHLCMHGFFKAYLFLGAGSAVSEKRLNVSYPPLGYIWLLSVLCGLVGVGIFMVTAQMIPVNIDNSLFLPLIAFIACIQFAMPILSEGTFKNAVGAFVFTALVGGSYGLSVHWMERFLSPLDLMRPTDLTSIHLIGIGLLVGSWALMITTNHLKKLESYPAYWKWFVFMLNRSQPHKDTITSHRNDYRYQSEVNNG